MRRNPVQLVLTLLAALPSTYAQAHSDGLIVPFSSGLPVCASQCGVLFDVQGKCTPPNIASVDSNCFCTDSRLAPIDSQPGNTGVSQICLAASCTTDADLSAVKTWFDDYCATKRTSTTSSSTPGATSTGSSGGGQTAGSGGQTWLQGHYKWVIMLVILFVLIVGGWIAACLLRRRYIRKKEKEFEMRPPVAWGPHQMQGMTGGYNYGDGVSDANRGGKSGAVPYNKEAAIATPALAAGAGGKRESRGLKKKKFYA